MRCAFVDYLTENHEEEAMQNNARSDKIREFVEKFGLPQTHVRQIMDGNVDVIVDALIDAAMANAKRLQKAEAKIEKNYSQYLGNYPG